MMAEVALVHEFLERNAERLPEKIALVCDGQRLSYAEIETKANRLANALNFLGVQRGDRVALFLPNSTELVIAIFATLKAGGVFVVINHSTKPDKVAYILNNCQASAFFTWPAQTALAADLLAGIQSLKVAVISGSPLGITESDKVYSFEQLLAQHSPSRPLKVNIDLDLACLIYTSGSTGEPKGVMSDHSNVVFAVGSITSYLQNHEDDVVIGILPLSFDYGLYQLLMVFSFGGRLVLEKGFTYPAAILETIQRERVTGFPGVPTIYSMLVNLDLSSYDLSSLRYMSNTAAALPPAHILKIQQTFPWVILYSMYGLTETKRTLYLPPEQLERRPDSVGIAIPGTEVWIEDENGQRLGGGQTGELVVRGRHVMRGYWGDPKLSAVRYRSSSILGERLCYTGDLFRMDDEGYFYFVARKDDIIKSRGEKVSPKEVENAVYKLEGVQEVAVIGVQDDVLGQAVKVFVVVKDGNLNEKDILRHCRAHLEDYMVPKYVELVTELPKTSSGKIKKTDLK